MTWRTWVLRLIACAERAERIGDHTRANALRTECARQLADWREGAVMGGPPVDPAIAARMVAGPRAGGPVAAPPRPQPEPPRRLICAPESAS
jgi:hypothetical protein